MIAVNQLQKKKRVAIDVGYGQVKATDGEQTVTFPAVWGMATEADFQTGATAENYKGDDVYDDDGHWLVGYKALKHVPPNAQQNLRGRLKDETSFSHQARLRLIKAVFAKLFPKAAKGDIVQVTLATGLPVAHMGGAAAFKELLMEPIKVVTDDEREFVVQVLHMFVMPQPYGTLYRTSLLPDGRIDTSFTATRVGVVDVGTYSTDVALDDEGEYIDQQSGTIEMGVSTVQDAIIAEYKRRHSQTPGFRDVEQAIKTGYIKVYNQPESFHDVRNQAANALAKATLGLCSRLWQAGADIDIIFVTGGGASFVLQELKTQYPQAVLVEDAEVANAIGYRLYAENQIFHADEN